MILRNVRFLSDYGGSSPAATVVIRGETIESVRRDEAGHVRDDGDDVIDLDGVWVLPGCIDPHVHVRDLGQRHKEDWQSAGAAALAGGYTTIFDMPNTEPPTNDLRSLERKRQVAAAAPVDVRLWLGTTEENLADLQAILDTSPRDVAGIKVFLAGSSSNEVVHRVETLHAIMQLAARHELPVAVHQELQSCLDAASIKHLEPHARNHGLFRPRECVLAGATLALETAAATGCTLYLLHMSTEEEIELLHHWKQRSPVYGEATPHHLFIDESLLQEIGNLGKINPPLRTKQDNSALLDALSSGIIDIVGSDHAPHTLEEKSRPYLQAPSGFPGLETTLGLLLNAAAQRRISYNRLAEITSAAAARLFRFADRGRIAEGTRADLTLVYPEEPWTVCPEQFHTRARFSPYAGMTLRGRVAATIAAGVYHPKRTEGRFDEQA